MRCSALILLSMAILTASLPAEASVGPATSVCNCTFQGQYQWRMPGPADARSTLMLFDHVRRQRPGTTLSYATLELCESMATAQCADFCSDSLGRLIDDALGGNPEDRMFNSLTANSSRGPCIGGQNYMPVPGRVRQPGTFPGHKPIGDLRTALLPGHIPLALPNLSPQHAAALQKALVPMALGGAALATALKLIGTAVLNGASTACGIFIVVPPTMPMKSPGHKIPGLPPETCMIPSPNAGRWMACDVADDLHVVCAIPGTDGATVHIAFDSDDLENEVPAIWTEPRV
jgi:hypothetical protein